MALHEIIFKILSGVVISRSSCAFVAHGACRFSTFKQGFVAPEFSVRFAFLSCFFLMLRRCSFLGVHNSAHPRQSFVLDRLQVRVVFGLMNEENKREGMSTGKFYIIFPLPLGVGDVLAFVRLSSFTIDLSFSTRRRRCFLMSWYPICQIMRDENRAAVKSRSIVVNDLTREPQQAHIEH